MKVEMTTGHWFSPYGYYVALALVGESDFWEKNDCNRRKGTKCATNPQPWYL